MMSKTPIYTFAEVIGKILVVRFVQNINKYSVEVSFSDFTMTIKRYNEAEQYEIAY